MIRFKGRFLGFRRTGSFVGIVLLILVIYLLVLDPPRRKAFVVDNGLWIVDGIEWCCDQAKDWLKQIDKNEEVQPKKAEPNINRLPFIGIKKPQQLRHSVLPGDFSAALDKEVADFDVASLTARYHRMRAQRDRRETIRLAVELAIDLPRRWWTVDGAVVEDPNLFDVLNKRGD